MDSCVDLLSADGMVCKEHTHTHLRAHALPVLERSQDPDLRVQAAFKEALYHAQKIDHN